MVSILPSHRTPGDLIGADVGQALQSVLPQSVGQGYQRGLGLNALDQAQKDIGEAGGDPYKIALAFSKVGAVNPNLQRSIAPLYETALNKAMAMNASKSPLAGEAQQPRNREPMEGVSPRQPAPTFMGQTEKESEFFPSNVGPQGGRGNVPQQATSGVKEQIPTPEEEVELAKKLARERTANNIPTKPQDALVEVQQNSERKRQHNAEVDKELQQRIAGQERYGNKAVDYINQFVPDANPELQAIFKKIGEDASKRGESEAETDRYLANEAKKYKNAIVNVEKSMSAPRLLNSIERAIKGTYKDMEAASDDIRKHLDPLLELGLFDTARNLLAKKGYGVEERESIINPLSTHGKAVLNQIPSQKKEILGVRAPLPADLQQDRTNNIKEGLKNLQQAQSNFSLPLARKYFEDKNYDWREFKDGLNQLIEEGFKLSDDQQIQMGILDSPPLNLLDKFLHGINIIGR